MKRFDERKEGIDEENGISGGRDALRVCGVQGIVRCCRNDDALSRDGVPMEGKC